MPGLTRPEEPMEDADAITEGNARDSLRLGGGGRVKTLPGATDTAASFEFLNEDHTIGNALRYIIMKNPEVEFCGYSIPHPAEPKMNLRIQTYEGTTALEALEKGLSDLIDLCSIVEDKFVAARDDFMSNRMQD